MFRVPNISGLYNVLEAAVRADDAAAGLMLLVGRDGATLEVAAEVGMPAPMRDPARQRRVGDGSASGDAVRDRRRVVIRDVQTDPTFEQFRPVFAAAGMRAIHAAPLIGSDRQVSGALVTFYSKPHHPSGERLQRLDQICRVAVALIEVVRLHDAMVRADREMGIPQRALSPAAAQAADAARVLLPSLSRQTADEALLKTTERHLNLVTEELASNLRGHRGA